MKLLIILVLPTFLLVGNTFGAPLNSTITAKAIQKGYRYLGEANNIEYMVSTSMMTQEEGLIECRSLGGQLLSIIDGSENTAIWLFLLPLQTHIKDHFWTSGRYNNALGGYTWLSLGGRWFGYKNWLGGTHHEPSPGIMTGVTVFGTLPFGWCSNTAESSITSQHRTVCQFTNENVFE